jgi:hypothetical protein
MAMELPKPLVGLRGRAPRYLDNGFWIVTAVQAKGLAGGRLPRHGYAMDRTVEGARISVQRTPVGDRQVWACYVRAL